MRLHELGTMFETTCSRIFVLFAAWGLSGSLAAQEGLWQKFGNSEFELFGAAVCTTPDMNGDEVADVLVGAPQEDSQGQEAGAAFLLSGADGTVLRSFFGSSQSDRFGSSVAAVGDLDGDDVCDLLVGAHQRQVGRGYVRLFSGATGDELRSLPGTAEFGQFGASLAPAGDVNCDGVEDFLVGAPTANRLGQAIVFSGKGGILFTINGSQPGDLMGSAVSPLGDINGDGFPELLVGASQVFTSRPGYVLVVNGFDGRILRSIPGQFGGDSFGHAIAGGGDVDGDQVPDFIVGAPQLVELCNPPGYARVYSGATLSVLHEFFGTRQNDAFGAAVALDGDANGDGQEDVLVGAPQSFLDCGFGRTGYVRLFSGCSGLQLYEWQGDTLGDPIGGSFGAAVGFVPDIDLDADDEIVIAASSEASASGQQPGRVDVYLGNDLFLEARPRQVAAGTTLVLNTSEGEPGAPTILVLRELNDVPLLLVLGPLARFGSSGRRRIELTIPPGLGGFTLGLEAYALSSSLQLIHTAIEQVEIR